MRVRDRTPQFAFLRAARLCRSKSRGQRFQLADQPRTFFLLIFRKGLFPVSYSSHFFSSLLVIERHGPRFLACPSCRAGSVVVPRISIRGLDSSSMPWAWAGLPGFIASGGLGYSTFESKHQGKCPESGLLPFVPELLEACRALGWPRPGCRLARGAMAGLECPRVGGRHSTRAASSRWRRPPQLSLRARLKRNQDEYIYESSLKTISMEQS